MSGPVDVSVERHKLALRLAAALPAEELEALADHVEGGGRIGPLGRRASLRASVPFRTVSDVLAARAAKLLTVEEAKTLLARPTLRRSRRAAR